MSIFRRYFSQWGLASTMFTDKGSVFASQEMDHFLLSYGIRHENSSYLPLRRRSSPQHKLIECIQTKAGKRLVLANLSDDGSLDQDRLANALFLHRNMADPIDGLSPAEVLYGTKLQRYTPLDTQEYIYVNPSKPLKFVPDYLF